MRWALIIFILFTSIVGLIFVGYVIFNPSDDKVLNLILEVGIPVFVGRSLAFAHSIYQEVK